MNIIFIIYIFVLFVITSPNVLIKLTKIDDLSLTILHGLLFTFIVYISHSFVLRYREGVKIGTLEENNNEKSLHMSTDLGLDELIKQKSATPEESNVVTINNTILDYSKYNDPLQKMTPLPGPIPDFFKDDYASSLESQKEETEQMDDSLEDPSSIPTE